MELRYPFAAKIAQSYGDVEAVSIENYRHPKNEFDVVVIHHVIEHLTDPSLAISKICKMLKPGGLLIIGTPDFDCGAARGMEMISDYYTIKRMFLCAPMTQCTAF